MSIGRVGEFDVKNGTWSSYVDRINMYFKVNNVGENLKLPTLIAVMGDEAYELLVNLASPKVPADITYEEAVKLLENHLQPAPSVLAERYRFRQRRQNAGENIAGYVAELKRLSRNCRFKDGLNENLRDQFVCGLRSDVTRQRLFAEDDAIVFSEAVKIATSLEAAERDSAAVEAMGPPREEAPGAAESVNVHAVSVRGSSEGGRGRGRGRAPRGRGPRGAPAGGGGRGAYLRRCAGCGAVDHEYASCRFQSYVCSRCRRTGHLRRMCPERDERAAGPAGRAARYPLHYGEPAEDHEEVEVQADQHLDQELHQLCLNDYRAI
ncbi:uncharacterized protein LOC125489168 [Plutella xylostella]|uniref:uncharacterized protein LOC125489168 n=1 Tax=Plutella xylostella TaxID=51655 RepID=UPI0018D19413|nr:uncharacterized protein LOC125489168 [Plutella xylostella]